LSLAYSGPVRLNTFSGQDQRPVKANLSYTFNLASGDTGVLRNYINIAGLQSTTDWASFTDLYQEFRVLAIELQYIPHFNGSYTADRIQGSGAVCSVHVPLAANPSTLDEVVQHVTWSPFRTSAGFKKSWKMFGVEESTFAQVGSVNSTNHGGIQFYCDTLSDLAEYGLGVVTYLVEFRARK